MDSVCWLRARVAFEHSSNDPELPLSDTLGIRGVDVSVERGLLHTETAQTHSATAILRCCCKRHYPASGRGYVGQVTTRSVNHTPRAAFGNRDATLRVRALACPSHAASLSGAPRDQRRRLREAARDDAPEDEAVNAAESEAPHSDVARESAQRWGKPATWTTTRRLVAVGVLAALVAGVVLVVQLRGSDPAPQAGEIIADPFPLSDDDT